MRQLVFVTGEAGIGKTTVVDAFLAQVGAAQPVWIGRGQCIEHYGGGEAYLPLLDALGRLGRGPDERGWSPRLRQAGPHLAGAAARPLAARRPGRGAAHGAEYDPGAHAAGTGGTRCKG